MNVALEDGLKEMPSQIAYCRYFVKFNQQINTEVFLSLQDWFMNRFSIENITIDFDSTVITRHGDQQGSTKEYNPNKRGRNPITH